MAKDYVLYGGNTGKPPPSLDKIDLDVDQPRYTRYGHQTGVRMRRPVRKQYDQGKPDHPTVADESLDPKKPQELRTTHPGTMRSARPWGVFKADATKEPVAIFTGADAEMEAGKTAARYSSEKGTSYTARLVDDKPHTR